MRHVLTANGDLRLRRRYYWLDLEHRGFPADRLLGVDEHGVSVRAREACCRFSMMTSFADAAAELRRYAGIPISAEFLRQIAEREGGRIAATREQGLLPSDLPARVGQRLYASLDGVFARMVTSQEKQERRRTSLKRRGELPAERQAKLPTLRPMRPGHGENFREMKLGVFYTQDRGRRHSFVTCENHERAGELVKRHAQGVGFTAGTGERVAVVDGAVWIEAELRRNLPGLDMLLLDFFHLSQHVHEAAKACLGEGADGVAWARARLEEFKAMGPQVALANFRATLATLRRRPCRRVMQNLISYVEKREGMLGYPDAIRRGWDIGSGPMEAQCKAHIRRVKLPGAKWDQEHAQGMMDLAALHASNQWAAYWRRAHAA